MNAYIYNCDSNLTLKAILTNKTFTLLYGQQCSAILPYS